MAGGPVNITDGPDGERPLFPGRSSLPEQIRRPLRAAVAAYAVLLSSAIISDQPSLSGATSQPRAAQRRAASVAYQFGYTYPGTDQPSGKYVGAEEQASRQRRALRSNDALSFFGRLPPDETAGEGELALQDVTMPHQARRQAVRASAYWIPPRPFWDDGTALEEPTVECRPLVLPDRVQRPRRAASEAYWLRSDVVLADDDSVYPRQVLPERVLGARRAQNEAYWQNQNTVATLVEFEDVRVELRIGLSLPQRAAGPRRAGSAAYGVALSAAQTQDAPPLRTLDLPVARLYSPRRAPAQAYHASLSSLIIDDETTSSLRMQLPVAAPRQRRASADAYALSVRPFWDDGTAHEQPQLELRPLVLPARADGASRAGGDAYWLPNTTQVPEDDPAGNGGGGPGNASSDGFSTPTAFVQVATRARPEAYWMPPNLTDALTSEEGPPLVLRIGLLVPQTAPGARRAGSAAYWQDVLPALGEDDLNVPKTFVSDRQRQSARAVAEAYALYSMPLPPPDEVSENLRALLPERAPGPRRAAADAYELRGVPEVVSDEPQEDQRLVLPERAPGKPRAASSAYDVLVQFAVQDEPQTGTTVQIPERADGARRAPAEAYHTASTFAVTDEPSTASVFFTEAARGPLRTANPSYWFSNELALDEPTIGDEIWPERVYGPRRAPESAYWIVTRELAEELPGDRPRGYQEWLPIHSIRSKGRYGWAPTEGYNIAMGDFRGADAGRQVTGPYQAAAGYVWIPGAQAGNVYVPGAVAGHVEDQTQGG